jgi:hypothetical protein
MKARTNNQHPPDIVGIKGQFGTNHYSFSLHLMKLK